MGMVKVQFNGSFGDDFKNVSAQEGGHANAIQRAIKFLIEKLPAAIQEDHRLHDRSEYPPLNAFGEGHDL